MNLNQLNHSIRQDIIAYLRRKHRADTRIVIKIFAKKWQTSKQRISANLKVLKYDEKKANISTIVPNRKSFIY